MVSGSSAFSVDLKQQNTLNPAQTNRVNVTGIWRLDRIFLRLVLKDFGGFGREGRDFFLLWKSPETFGGIGIEYKV